MRGTDSVAGSFYSARKPDRGNDSVASVEIVCEPRRTGKISIIAWSRKLTLPLKEKTQLRKDDLKLKPIWRISKIARAFNVIHCLSMFHRPLLDVPGSFPSFCSTPLPSTPNSLLMTGIRRLICATPPGGLQFGHLAQSTLLTGCEAKTCIDVSSERTPINYPSKRNSSNLENNDSSASRTMTLPPSRFVARSLRSFAFFALLERSLWE